MKFISLLFEWLGNNWLDLLLVLVGASAFGVYFWQKKTEEKAAATLILCQIDTIEKNVDILKNDPELSNLSVFHSQVIINENMWEKYKHLFVKTLDSSEYNFIQNFFDQAVLIERARSEIIGTIEVAWHDKSTVEHTMIGEMLRDNPNLSLDVIINFQSRFRPLDIVFTPDIAIKSLIHNLKVFNKLSGTTAYTKIKNKTK